MDFQKMTFSQQKIHLINKYVDPDTPIFDLQVDVISINLHMYGFDLTELYLKRHQDKKVCELFKWFEEYLRDRIGVYATNERLKVEDDPEEHEYTRSRKRYAKLVKHVRHFSFNGHMNYGASWRDAARGEFLKSKLGYFIMMDYMMSDEDLELMFKFREDPSVPMPRFVPFDKESALDSCGNCCEDIRLETNGHEVRIVGACKYPLGYPPWSVEVDFPTGRLALNDDLRPWFREAWRRTEEGEKKEDWRKFDINRTSGIHETAKVYAEYGYMTGFVGNTCPGVYQDPNDPGRLIIGSPRVLNEEEWETEDTIFGFELIGSICTDLWWYSIADMQHIENTVPLTRTFDGKTHEMGLEPDPDRLKKERCLFYAQVPPGRYRAYNLFHLLRAHGLDDDPDLACVYAYIERVGDCSDEKGDEETPV